MFTKHTVYVLSNICESNAIDAVQLVAAKQVSELHLLVLRVVEARCVCVYLCRLGWQWKPEKLFRRARTIWKSLEALQLRVPSQGLLCLLLLALLFLQASSYTCFCREVLVPLKCKR